MRQHNEAKLKFRQVSPTAEFRASDQLDMDPSPLFVSLVSSFSLIGVSTYSQIQLTLNSFVSDRSDFSASTSHHLLRNPNG